MKTTVVVSRKWNNPQIEVCVCKEKIEVKMSIEDFIKALCIENKNPATIMTVKGLEKRLLEASKVVISGMKAETTQVV